jgi:exosortase
MIPPILDIITNKVHWPFQLFTAAMASEILKIMNIPVLQELQFITMPNVIIEVANSCSGVRYLVSILAIAIPLSFFTQTGWFRRGLIIVPAIIVGILANPVRVALISAWLNNGGEPVHGPYHLFQGFFVSFIGLMFIFIWTWALWKVLQNSSLKVCILRNLIKPQS